MAFETFLILYPINEKCPPPGIIATPVDHQRAAVGWTGVAIDFLTGARGQIIGSLGQVIAPLGQPSRVCRTRRTACHSARS